MHKIALLVGRVGHRKRAVLGVFTGVLIGLGQAPFGLPAISVLGLLAGFFLFDIAATPKQAASIGWALGVGYFGVVLSWIVEPFLVDAPRYGWMAPFALVGMAAGMALFWGAAFGLARRFGGVFALVVFWALAEVTRAYILTGFPWGLLAYIWLDTGLDQWAAFVGPHGLTLVTLGLVGVTYRGFYHSKRPLILPMIALVFVGLIGFGVARANFYFTPKARAENAQARPIVRLIQPNAPQDKKWDPKYYYDYFAQNLEFTAAPANTASTRPDLIIWPETAIPFLLNQSPNAILAISNAAGAVPVVSGIQRRQDQTYYNSLIVIGADGKILETYDKSHLVPFGEYAPGGALASAFGFQGLAANDGFAFGAGRGLRTFDLGPLARVLPLICYEAIFPDEIGQKGSDFDWMLQITNDAWFGNFSGPFQHLAQARFRAIEQGKPMARAANTGVSAMIDARGKITAQIALNTAGFLDIPLPRSFPNRAYGAFGDTPVFILLFIGLVLIAKRHRIKNIDARSLGA